MARLHTEGGIILSNDQMNKELLDIIKFPEKENETNGKRISTGD